MKIKGQLILRPVVWLGDSKKNILRFPEEVRKLIGDELQLIQFSKQRYQEAKELAKNENTDGN